MTPAIVELIKPIRGVVEAFVEEYKKDVPLLAIDWSDKLTSWADK
jgi:hypothetical protein